jgi:uncharacterized protein YecE (DUF72 family)
MKPRIHIGTQSWSFDAWVGPFYPLGTRPADYLTVYARAFNSVEVDSTFYAIPPVSTLRGWRERTPEQFTFELKLPQEITHERRLRNSEDVVQLFAERARELGNKLGPVLIQLGPDFGPVELPALAKLLPALPRDIRFSVEFRNRGWITDGVLALLAEHGVGLTLTDGRWFSRKQMLALTSRIRTGFVYVRLIGGNRDLVDYSRIQIDRTGELEQWAATLRPIAGKADVYVYTSNQFAGHSPQTARELQKLLGQTSVAPEFLGDQMSLFL